MVDLLQVPFEENQDKNRTVGMNNDSGVWPRIFRPAGLTCILPVLINN